jgi:hypothetical protein
VSQLIIKVTISHPVLELSWRRADDRRCASGRRTAEQGEGRGRRRGRRADGEEHGRRAEGRRAEVGGHTPHTGAAARRRGGAAACSAAPRTAAAGGSRSLGFRFWEREGETERAARREKPEEAACGAGGVRPSQ